MLGGFICLSWEISFPSEYSGEGQSFVCGAKSTGRLNILKAKRPLMNSVTNSPRWSSPLHVGPADNSGTTKGKRGLCSPTEDVQTRACLTMAVGVGEALDRSSFFLLSPLGTYTMKHPTWFDATWKCTHTGTFLVSLMVVSQSILTWGTVRSYHLITLISTFNTLWSAERLTVSSACGEVTRSNSETKWLQGNDRRMVRKAEWMERKTTGDLFLLLFHRTNSGVTGHHRIQDVKKDVCSWLIIF